MKTENAPQPGLLAALTGSPFFVFDVESVGLHGEAFAVAGGLYTSSGAALWEFRLSCPLDECHGESDDRQWVKQNVPPIEETHRHPKPMRDEFWRQWEKAKAAGALMAVECGWPVEAGFLAACIRDDLPARRWNGPYPLHEIASYLAASGMDPMATYERTASEQPAHDPLADARLSARLLGEALARMANEKLTA